MKKIAILFSLIALVMILIQACSGEHSGKETKKSDSISVHSDSSSKASCSPIKDPNNPKPMALMMRQMAANADSMRSQLLRGEKIDSIQYPFIRFYLVEPTDPNVLEPQFFENARLFQAAYKELFSHPKEQKLYYNKLINACINCHQMYCSGPLKRIRKFPIDL